MEEDSHINELTLSQLSSTQLQSIDNPFKKIIQFIKFHFVQNPFESFVLQNEANDCSLIAKFQKTVDIDLSNTPELSISSLSLNAVHIPHPLETYLLKNHSDKDDEVRKDLQDTPIVLFIHGLGGQISQFEPLMALFSQCSEIWGVDLPGFGNSRSDFKGSIGKSITELSEEDSRKISTSVNSMAWDDFKTDNIVEILYTWISQYIPKGKKLVIIGHSMGTHLTIKLVKRLDQDKVEAIVLLSPPALSSSTGTVVSKPPSVLKFFSYVPSIFNSFRIWDRLPGFESKSVLRQLIPETNIFNKLRQLRWNLDVNSSIVLKYVNNFQKASNSELLTTVSKIHHDDESEQSDNFRKVLIVGGTNDVMTPPKAIFDMESLVNSNFDKPLAKAIEIKDVGHSILLSKPEFTSGTVINFIEQNCPERLHLSPAWVLRVKADISGDKWGLKNEMKWMALQPISTNIVRKNGKDVAPLLGMKTLREGDSNHSPKILESIFYDESGNPKHSSFNGQLIAVIDISHDIPPYSPNTFKFVKYYKCATVSKVVPDSGSIRRFIRLIDDILESTDIEDPLIVVHCHYGFNRTGFLICCYLIEKLGWSVQEAVDGYKMAKAPGIKHPHFIDALYVRYES
ncbi:hypothetical protein CLIB1423_01S05798 [[Candida] railenensis]|uniref:Tyrosine specific protein phosphatases domain-containing protein n=1 Tax=[Candida] railenensis TaxID=45579 RepID=A0A9P0VW90_9ASCO|nr:hypothetical protein CLIB1423_01S05798 [[Candida] railenensis]